MRATLSALTRRAARTAAAAAAAAASRAVSLSESGEASDTKPKPCLQLTMLPESSEVVLGLFAPLYARIVADRVLIRPCMTEAHESLSLRPLAVVNDGSTQSLLIVPLIPLWFGEPDLSGSSVAGVGYPVLPISIAEQEIPKQPPPPPAKASAGAADSSATGADAAGVAAGAAAANASSSAAAEGEEAEVPTLWEQVELPWQLLEAAGVLCIERDANAMPVSVSLFGGVDTWTGTFPAGSSGSRAPRTVTVRLLDRPTADGLGLAGRTAEPECGFCRFMKNGPCGAEFVAWEACVDAARDAKEDFVQKCGKATLLLKACTDAHPEYYGELSGDDDGDAPPPPPPPPPAQQAQSSG